MRRTLPALTIAVAFALAACSGGATASPSAGATEPPPSAGATEPPPSAGATEPPASTGADPCAPSTDPGTVTASIIDFSFDPATVTAKVGDVVAWTNAGDAPHTATLDDHPDCATGRLEGGDSGGIEFTAAGTYPFHCAIHPQMTGTVEVTE